MDENTLVNLTAGLGGLGSGLVIAVLSLWWNYKTRSSPYREHLYQQQIQVYSQMASAMSSIHKAATDALTLNEGSELTPQTRSRLNELAKKVDTMVSEVRDKTLLLCPIDVVIAFSDYCDQIGKLHEARYPQEFVKILFPRKVYDAVRNHTGVERLSDEMLKIFLAPLYINEPYKS